MKLVLLNFMNAKHQYGAEQLKAAATRKGHEILEAFPSELSLSLYDGQMAVLVNGQNILTHADGAILRLGIEGFNEGYLIAKQLELNGLYCLSSAESSRIARNKYLGLQHLAQHGIPIPRTLLMPSHDQILSFTDTLRSEKIVIKTNAGSGGCGVMLGENALQALAITDFLRAQKTQFLIQEFIEESAGRDIRCLVLGGKVVGAIERVARDEREFRSNFCLGGDVNPMILTEAEKQLAIDASRAIGLELAGVDLIRAHDKTYVLEVNGNPGFEGVDTAHQTCTADKIIDYVVDQIRSRQTSAVQAIA